MTQNFHNEYLDLIGTVTAYIAQEYPTSTSLVADPETFNYFKKQAQQRTQAPAKTSISPLLASPQNAAKSPQPTPASSVTPPKEFKETEKKPNLPIETPKEREAQTVEKIKLSPQLKREALEPSKLIDYSELCKLWQENYPHTPVIMTIPSDEQAKVISRRWQNPPTVPNIVLLCFNENPHEIAFLNNVAAAITQYFGSAGLIAAVKVESEKNWNKLLSTPSLKLIIAPHHSLYTLPDLMKQYCEDPLRGNHTLGRVPLLLLSDLSLYMQQPKLKIALWQTLCQRFAAKR
ncbi:MAG: hypothetical protein H0U49_00450 [Parachlamydiaceae bacterium]|nr:hypothetical protein [Parachlamydiaceae bacterium]